jgi:hypothetical protein
VRNSKKIRPVRVSLFHADGHDKASSQFLNSFANEPQKIDLKDKEHNKGKKFNLEHAMKVQRWSRGLFL